MKLLFLGPVVATLLVGCVHYGANPNAAYYLSKAQLQANERDALAGDNASARRIANYYYFIKNDRGNSIWWNKLAAFRNDPVAKENLKQLQRE